jgi:2-methylisocitrate lyase-like PEP mutase family enzyme
MNTPDPVQERCRVFHELHASGCFVIPNPWDVGSARTLEHLGFPALATTSAGFAWSVGRADNHIALDQALAHFRTMAEAATVPVSADFEGGFAVEPADVASHVTLAARTGIAGLSIEDSTHDPDDPLFDFALSVERVAAARRAIDASGARLVFVARSEGFIVGRPDIAETIRRLAAYAEAGADCLYAPGIRTTEHIAAVVQAVAPKAVNVGVGTDFTTVEALRALGVRRISVGGALARTAWTGFLEAASEIAGSGTFTALARGVPGGTVNGMFK